MADRDLVEFRQYLREIVRVLRMPARALERRLGIGNGMLPRFLDGRYEIRLRHVIALAELLGVAPGDLLAAGCAEATGKARRRMTDWVPVSGASQQGRPLPATVEGLRDLIRDAVREELDAWQEAVDENRPPARRKKSQNA